jgi:hypothetical protein
MSRAVRTAVLAASLVFFLFSSSVLTAQEKTAAGPAPVPSTILTAKKAFISNAGLDGLAFEAFRKVGDVDQPYNAFYAAMNSWAKYELVSAPSEADLVFEIRFTAPFVGEDHVPRNTPQLNLTIYDARTRFVLWTILAPVDGAFRKTTFVRNVNQWITTLMANLKSLHGEPVNSAAAAK